MRGLNLDSDPFDPTSNGAGKSLLFSCIANLLYFSPPSATRKNSKKELIQKDSENTLVFTDSKGVCYEITQTAKRYDILEDGKDLKFTRMPEAEKFIRKIFPITEADFYTYCYLSTQRPHWVYDTNTNRLDQLTALFRLDTYDLMKVEFAKRLASVKTNEIKLAMLEQRLLEDRLRIKKLVKQKKESDTDKDELKSLYTELDLEVKGLVKKSYDLNQVISTLTTLSKIEHELDALRKQYSYKKPPADMYKQLVKERKLIRAVDKYQEEVKVYDKTVKAIQAKLDVLHVPNASVKTLKKQLDEICTRLDEYEDNYERMKKAKYLYELQLKKVTQIESELDERLAELPKFDIEHDYGSDLAQCMSTLKLQDLLNHEHLDEDTNTCPVCLNEIDLDNIKQLVKRAKKQLPTLKSCTRAQNLTVQFDAEKVKLKKLEVSDLDFNRLCTDIDVLRMDRNHIDSQIDVLRNYKELMAELNSVEEPIKPKERPSLRLSLDEVDAQIELCSDILKHLEAKTRLLENDSALSSYRTVDAVEKVLSKKRKELDTTDDLLVRARSQLAKLSEEIENLTLVASELTTVKKNAKKLEQDISELKPNVEDKQILDTLVKAYSTKGLKTLVANQICTLLETNLNYYRDLTFAEPFTFTVHASETGLSIMVDRHNGVVSDVRNLSGAESNSFRLLFLLSILVLIPDERRLNVVVLDEPCSHADEVSRQIFLEKYLPALQEIVSHIYVITPHLSDNIEGSSLLVVKKENGKSTLHTKFPK